MTSPRGGVTFSPRNGIMNRVDPVEVGFEGYLQAINVFLSNGGKSSRRDGFGLIHATGGRDIWNNGSHCLFVSGDGWLTEMSQDRSTITPVRDVGTRRMAYADVMGMAHYSNGVLHGVIDASGDHLLSGYGTYELSAPFSIKEDQSAYDPMPPGTILEYHAGILYAYSPDDECIWFSRRNNPRKCNKEDDFIRLASVTMIAAVGGGVYFGGSFGVYWMAGNNPAAESVPVVTKVADEAPLEGSMLKLDGSLFGNKGWPGVIATWESSAGKNIGGPDGQVFKATEKSVGYPVGERASSILLRSGGQNFLLGVMQKPGDNDHNFRATDYASAEIRRNGIIIT